MTDINKVFKIPVERNVMVRPNRQSPEQVDDFSVKKVVQAREIVTGDHNDGSRPEVVNVVYGTSETPPTANTTTEGTLYIQYTA